ncbi:MAG: VOC family protein [Bermanella sp.]
MTLEYAGSEKFISNKDTPPGCKPIQRAEPIIKVDRLAYLLWDEANLDKQEAFLLDFGMNTHKKDEKSLYMRGFGDEPYLYVARKAKKSAFRGLGVCVNSREELERLANETGSAIENITHPGGGEVVRLTDPKGNEVEVCFGIEKVTPLQTRREPLIVNAPGNPQRVNSFQRSNFGPSPVLKIGHCVLGANNIEETIQWYMKHLGVIATDVLCVEDGSPAIAFLRLDRGEEHADHHTIVIGKGGGEGYMHSAYEVVDVDAVAQGQQYLKMKKRNHYWGMGRHFLGSQVFDYWLDINGNEFEHYTDGDVFTGHRETAYHPLDPGNIYAWGDDLPSAMFRPKPRQIWNILGGLFKGDISFSWVKQAKKATSRSPRPWL